MVVLQKCESACAEVFGDHKFPTYGDAQQRYYESGPKHHWRANYVSGYATMGLIDYLPEIFTPAVVKKIAFVNDLLRAAKLAGASS